MLNDTNDKGASVVPSFMEQLANPALHRAMEYAVIRAAGQTGASMDLVHDAIMKMIEHEASFDPARGTMEAWGCRIAGNLARNWRANHANRRHDSETIGDEDNEPASFVDILAGEDGRITIERRSDLTAVNAAVATLDDECQTFLSHLADGIPQTEAGALVGWSPATTSRRMRTIAAHLAGSL